MRLEQRTTSRKIGWAPARGRVLGFAITLILSAIMATLPSTPSSAAPAPESATASISGVVRDANGPVSGVKVKAYLNEAVIRTATTTTTGAFRLGRLMPGHYRVFADSPKIATANRDADVADGAVITGFDIVVERSGSISGVVRGPSGAVVVGAQVELVTLPFSLSKRFATTGTNGTYRFTDVTPGDHRLKATNAGLVGWYAGTPPGPVPVTINLAPAQRVTGRTIIIGPPVEGATMWGKLATSTGQGSNGSVKVYRADASNTFVGSYPVVNGIWTTAPLPAGAYLVLFTSPGETSEWYPDADDMRNAVPIALAGTGNVGPIDGKLDARVAVWARVTTPTGVPVSNSIVVAYKAFTNTVIGVATTDTNGWAQVGGIRVNAYYEFEARPASGSPLRASLRHLDYVYLCCPPTQNLALQSP